MDLWWRLSLTSALALGGMEEGLAVQVPEVQPRHALRRDPDRDLAPPATADQVDHLAGTRARTERHPHDAVLIDEAHPRRARRQGRHHDAQRPLCVIEV